MVEQTQYHIFQPKAASPVGNLGRNETRHLDDGSTLELSRHLTRIGVRSDRVPSREHIRTPSPQGAKGDQCFA